MVTCGNGFTVTVASSLAVQVLLFVTSTLYVPAVVVE